MRGNKASSGEIGTHKNEDVCTGNPISPLFSPCISLSLPLSIHLCFMSYHCDVQPDINHKGGVNPFTTRTSSISSSTDRAAEILQLCLQTQGLLTRALEVENMTLRDEVGHLWRRAQDQAPPVGDQPNQYTLGQQPLAERIDLTGQHFLSGHTINGHGWPFTPHTGLLLPPTVVVQPVGIHPCFLPLGESFQEGGMGGLTFSRPQDWPDAIN